MKGCVDAYDPVNGFGFIKTKTEDDKERMYFAHNSEIRLEMPVSAIADLGIPLPQFLLPGWDVEFKPVQQPDGRWKATEINPVNPMGFSINSVRQRPAVTQDGIVTIEIAGDNKLVITGRPVEPVVKAETFGLYYLGNGVVKSFNVKVPQPTAERAFVVITPSPEKAPRHATPDGLYQNVKKGSFVMAVWADGHVLVQKVGAHTYDFQENWMALARRFEHKYCFVPEPTQEELVGQTPDVGKADANWGFARGIIRGVALMKTAVAAK